MKIRIFQIVCVVIFFISFGYFFGDEYWEYQEERKNYTEHQQLQNKALEDFSLDTLSDSSGKMQLHTLPNKSFLDTLVSQIDAAQERIFVEVYIFTERDMRDALIRAHKRGIEVKIILENNPYQAPYLNDNHYNAFQDAGLDVQWSDPLNYSLNHSKLLIIDDRAYISTGNFSYSLFTKNRDFMISTANPVIVKKLIDLFFIDYNEQVGGVIHPNLIISPLNSRKKLTQMIQESGESIHFYFPYLNDDIFQEVFFQAAKKDIEIKGIVESNFYEENRNLVSEFQDRGIQLSSRKTPKIHAKALLIDKKYLYIGSVNFSTYSFDENREIGIIISDSEVISDFLTVFESDF